MIELHGHSKWVRGVEPPRFERLLRSAMPFERVDGISTLPAAEHAVLLAVHVWAHDPLTRLLRLIDVAAAANAADEHALTSVVREWRLEKLWRATTSVIEAVLYDHGPPPLAVRMWTRGPSTAREAAVWESYLGQLLGPRVVSRRHPRRDPRSTSSCGSCAPPQGSRTGRDRGGSPYIHALGLRRTEARRRDGGEHFRS